MTLRRIERLWNERQYQRLFSELMSARPEGGLHLSLQMPAAATAIALLRLDELTQSQAPVYGQLLRTLISQQHSDGGFGDPATTALCALQVGVCDAALRQTAAYLNERTQFGRPLSTFQGTMLRAADGAIDIEAMRVTAQRAAWLYDVGRDATEAA